MVEGALSQTWPASLPRLEGDGDVEAGAGDLAASARDDARAFISRRIDRALMWVRGQEADRAGGGSSIGQDGVWRADDLDLLEVAVGAGMEVRPGDVGGERVVDLPPGRIGVEVAAVEMVRTAEPLDCADRGPKVHMIPGYQQPATLGTEARDRRAILRREAISGVDGEQPQLPEVALVDRRQHRVRPARGSAIAHRDGIERPTLIVARRAEKRAKLAEPGDRPVVLGRRDRRLQQNSRRLGRHLTSSFWAPKRALGAKIIQSGLASRAPRSWSRGAWLDR